MTKHTPATSAAIAVPTFTRYRNSNDCHPSVPVDCFYHHLAATFTNVFGTAIPKASHRLPFFRIITNNICLCPSPPCWPKGQLPDCAPGRHVLRSRQSSKSDWQSFFSTMGAGSFVLGQFFLCTSAPENIDH